MSSTPRKAIWIPAVCVIAAAGIIAGLELSNTTHWLHSKPEPVAVHQNESQPVVKKPTKDTQTSKSQTTNSTSSPSPTIPGTTDNKVSSSPEPNSNIKLLAPTGTFANQYNVKLNQTLSSTCTTNAGVYCEILFTRDDTTKQLPKQLTDAGGNTAWTWKPSSIGLTPGTWHIKAVSSYQSQTKTTNNDPLTLTVSE